MLQYDYCFGIAKYAPPGFASKGPPSSALTGDRHLSA